MIEKHQTTTLQVEAEGSGHHRSSVQQVSRGYFLFSV
jgi:hypothetical protein